jgi:hypothetical protein
MPLNEYGEKLDSNGYAPSILHDKPVCRQSEQAEPEPQKDDAAPPLCETKTGQLTFF